MSKPPAPSDIADKFMLRMPEGMRDRLKAAAEENKRSMNAEIVSRLEYTLSDRDDYFTGFKGYIDEHMTSIREAVLKSVAIVDQDRKERIARDKIIQDSLAVLRLPPPTTEQGREDQNAKLRAGLAALEEERIADTQRSENLSEALEAPDFKGSPHLKKMVEFEKKHGFD